MLVLSVTRGALEELLGKYREMLDMRLAHAAGDEVESEARGKMVELASRFPGALREIDELELDAIRERIRRLDAALRGESEVEPWMTALVVFHGLARGALVAKRWLAGRKLVDEATARAYLGFAAPLASADALAWADDLASVAAPPRGRLMDLVFHRVAARLGTTEPEARRLVFGGSRRERRGGSS